MAYIGQSIKNGTFSVLDTSGNTYNGSNTTFSLGTQVGSAAQLLVSHDGVVQKPGTDYTLATGGTQITFTTAPASGASIFIVEISGAVGGTITPSDNSVGITQLNVSDGSNGQVLKTDGSGTLSFGSGFDADAAQVFNESGASVDFRVEGDTDTHLLMVDGSSDKVGIGEDVPEGKLHILTGDASVGPNGDADELVVEGSGASGISILSGSSSNGNILFGDSGGDEMGALRYLHASNALRFDANNAERMRLEGDKLLHAKTSAALGTVGTELYSTGVLRLTADSAAPLVLNREGSDGYVLSVNNDESFEGGITFSGGTITYQAFVGAHFSRLADNSKPTILRGTVLESIATMCDWYQAVADVAEVKDSEGNVITPAHKVKEMISLPVGKSVGDAVTFTSGGKEYTGTYVKETNERLPMCKISDTEDSKAVYGVFNAWDDQNDGLNAEVNDMIVASLGAYLVRIHKDETVAIGDYLQSKGDGTAKKQSDDIFRGSTIAKVISTEKTVTYDDGSYCVPCTLHCG